MLQDAVNPEVGGVKRPFWPLPTRSPGSLTKEKNVGRTAHIGKFTEADRLAVAILIATSVSTLTAPVETGKSTDCAPAGTVTDSGMTTAGLPLDSVTITPPEGAGTVSIAVPTAVRPPMTADGLNDNRNASATCAAGLGVVATNPAVGGLLHAASSPQRSVAVHSRHRVLMAASPAPAAGRGRRLANPDRACGRRAASAGS